MHPVRGIAVQRLNPRHRDEIVRHLLRLPAEDRRLRFGRPMRDDTLRAYALGIDFDHDRVFGILGADLELAALGHLALNAGEKTAELGLSVDHDQRARGYGFALLQRAVLHAANLGYRALFMYCLSENAIMMHLATKAGLTVVTESGDADGRLAIDRRAHGGAWREVIADQFALVDCMLKQQHLWLQPPPSAPPAIPRGTGA